MILEDGSDYRKSSPSALRDSFMNPPSQMFVNFLAEDITEDITGTERSHIVEVIAKALLNPGEGCIHPREPGIT
jgi:hypothetical protein